ncbi:MAG: CotH kinase family protein [Bacteroidales bacterium]|nr:CotH kinase family protein [Bacteroidales bacterium]
MKARSFILIALALLLSACQDIEPEVKTVQKPQPAGYTAVLAVYRAGHTYYEYTVEDSAVVLMLDDDSRVRLDISEIIFEDCSKTAPKVVAFDKDNMYMVGGESIDVMRDINLKDEDAYPFYVYFYNEGFHLRLSNSNHIVIRYQEKVLPHEGPKALPIIYLKTDDGKSVTSKVDYKPGTIEINDFDHKFWDTDVFKSKMQIRGRGNSTWDPWGKPKLPYMIKLEEKARLFNLSNDKSWNLLANWVDKSLLRNRVCFELSKIVGMSWTPRAVPVEVYFNGQYVGLYDFIEHKKVSKERVNINVDAGDMYFEIESNMDEPVCWETEHGHPIMFKDPELPTEAQQAYAKQFFKDFEDALWAKNFQDVYDKYIDVDSFINYWIVEEFSKDVDGNLRKSTFLTLTSGGKLEMYHLWDFDITLGNCDYYGDGKQPWEGWWVKDQNGHGRNHGWYYRLFMDPDFVAKVKTRWAQVYPQFKEFYNQIDVMVEEMGEAPARNFQKWQRLNVYDWPQYKITGSYQGEVDWLKENYRKRLDWMNTNIAKL